MRTLRLSSGSCRHRLRIDSSFDLVVSSLTAWIKLEQSANVSRDSGSSRKNCLRREVTSKMANLSKLQMPSSTCFFSSLRREAVPLRRKMPSTWMASFKNSIEYLRKLEKDKFCFIKVFRFTGCRLVLFFELSTMNLIVT